MEPSFLLRPAGLSDAETLYRLASTLAVRGFLTLPTSLEEWKELLNLPGRYVFVLEDLATQSLIGSSLLIARHGTPQFPHLALKIDETAETLSLIVDGKGMTELGGLILEPAFRRHPLKLGKALSLVRFLYLQKNPQNFCSHIIAEFLPPFAKDGTSPLWEALGKKLTGLSYREADERSRTDKSFFVSVFPKSPIALKDLPPEARAVIGKVGRDTEPAVKIVTSLGLHYLHHVDPFDGGPHYGAEVGKIRFEIAERFFEKIPEVECPFLRS